MSRMSRPSLYEYNVTCCASVAQLRDVTLLKQLSIYTQSSKIFKPSTVDRLHKGGNSVASSVANFTAAKTERGQSAQRRPCGGRLDRISKGFQAFVAYLVVDAPARGDGRGPETPLANLHNVVRYRNKSSARA